MFEFVVVDWFMSCHAVKCISCAICVVAFLSLLLLTGSCHGMQSRAPFVPFVLFF